jgi:arsenate reductase
MIIWHNPNCSKSRATIEYLDNNNIEYTIREYLKDVPSKIELEDVINKLNISNVKDMMRQKEDEFKELNLDSSSNAELIEAMIQVPKLIERPIAINNNKAAIGRPLENIINII